MTLPTVIGALLMSSNCIMISDLNACQTKQISFYNVIWYNTKKLTWIRFWEGVSVQEVSVDKERNEEKEVNKDTFKKLSESGQKPAQITSHNSPKQL